MNCPKCNQPVLANARFCGNCGSPIDPAAAAADPSATGAALGAAPIPPLVETGPGPGILERVKSILLSPKSEWPIIAPESTTTGQILTGYVIPLTVLAVVVSFVHMSVIGINLPFGGTIRTPMTSGLAIAALTFVSGIVGLFVVGLIINALAPTFGGARDRRQALKVSAYSLTPAYVSSLFSLLPSFGPLLQFVAGMYGIYLLYLGLPTVMRSDRQRAGGYTATVVICTILVGVVLVALSAVFGGVRHMAGLGGDPMSQDARAQQSADAVAGIIGGALGTDAQGKAGISSALTNLAKAGQQMEQQKATSAGSAETNSSSARSNNSSSSSGSAAAPADSPPANPMAAATGLLTALGGALGGDKRVEPVDFHTLEGMLPASLPGMTRTNAQGSSQEALGVKSSSATGSYRGDGDARVEIKIADASGVSGLMDLAGSLASNQTSESDSGYEKDVTIGGHPVHEKYDRPSKHAELGTIVAKRYAVGLTGDSVDMATLEQYLGRVDLSKLETMKDIGAK